MKFTKVRSHGAFAKASSSLGLIALSMGFAHPAMAETILSTAGIYNSGTGSTPRNTFDITGAVTIEVAASGLITLTPGYVNDPDGAGSLAIPHDVDGANGLSGISLSTGRAGALVGVFLPASDPTAGDPAPSALVYSLSDLTQASYSPLLEQVFFVGDGMVDDGAGAAQIFSVPTGATRLALGIADAENYQGIPGAYYDNQGSYSATVTLFGPVGSSVPEPSAWLMMIGGLALSAAPCGASKQRLPSHSNPRTLG